MSPLYRPLMIAAVALLATTVAPSPFCATLSAAPPTTSVSYESIATSYRDLAAAEPDRRNAARLHLMGLSRTELSTLRDLVAASQPVSPAQAVALREVVRHVFLATDTFERSPTQGFLGISSSPYNRGAATVVDPDGDADVRVGADFRSRTPGFCAYRWLQDGDVVLSLGADDGPLASVSGFMALSDFVKRTPPGTIIHMRVLRGGGVVTLSFPLDARPIALPDIGGDVQGFTNERLNRADAYWQQSFAPLVDADHT